MILSYCVTVLGFLLCVFFMVLIVLGKKSVGEPGSPQVIKFKDLEFKTNSALMLLVVSVIVAALPLVLQHYRPLPSCPPVSVAPPEKHELFITGYVLKPDGTPFEGAQVTLTRLTPDGRKENVDEQLAGSDGAFDFPQLPLGQGDKLKLITSRPGYVNQTLILGIDSLTYPAVLVQRK
jgi:hypothetical protein